MMLNGADASAKTISLMNYGAGLFAVEAVVFGGLAFACPPIGVPLMVASVTSGVLSGSMWAATAFVPTSGTDN